MLAISARFSHRADRMTVRAIAVVAAIALWACSKDGSESSKPTGTSADPVQVCERLADVCRIDKARLGVCTSRKSGPGLACAPQH
jgi:hypothetical protein